MKFRVLFKTPNASEYVIKDEVQSHSELCAFHEQGRSNGGSSDYCEDCEKQEEKRQDLKAEMEAVVKKFVEYDENVVIEFDTEAGTATVIPLKR